MFPLKTLPNARRAPHVTRLIILINVLVFMGQWFERTFMSVDSAVYYGVVPRCSLFPGQCGLGYISGEKHFWLTLFTSLFLHADILHIGFNMLFLSVFGGGLEDKFGRLRFLLVYFGGGIIAGLTHVAFHPFSLAPTIGASGAIAAVMGAYLIALPKSWVLTYIPPFFFLPVPAPLFLVV